jgi:hypothetical protein
MSGVTIRKPTERRCERCGRVEVWNEEECRWRVARRDGELLSGNVYGLHEWDINGTFVPFEE